MNIAGEADSGEEAVKWCRNNHADVVLMDMNMPGIGGLEATKKILRLNPDVKIIVLTIHTENPFPTKVMQAGAAGYLTKGDESKKWGQVSMNGAYSGGPLHTNLMCYNRQFLFYSILFILTPAPRSSH